MEIINRTEPVKKIIVEDEIKGITKSKVKDAYAKAIKNQACMFCNEVALKFFIKELKLM
jgi:hypothetical protein